MCSQCFHSDLLCICIYDIYFRYHVEFSVPWNTCIHPDEKTVAPAVIAGSHNANCHIVDFAQEKDGLR